MATKLPLFTIFLLSSTLLLPSSACPQCPHPVPKPPPPPPPTVIPCPPPPPPPKRPPPPPPTNPPPPPPTYPPPPPPILPPPPPPPPQELPCPPPPPPAAQGKCPIDALKLDACVDVLGGLIQIGIGPSAGESCCPVVTGLVGVDAALCLCTAIKLKLLNINLLLPIALDVLVDSCGKHVPDDFQCPDS
ncbi:36.4 kDa proline-rich protein [Apostasia shenzhenica]|uniref:36.4 kDa proline-rich protein n=1 Tax=Apostasia shenzhenica TaxID=1088818 RepID=A0A2H9ZTQ4_9ASPA|nr:36.4 kDa proline-rich protein [Apostasia shenzhenica]